MAITLNQYAKALFETLETKEGEVKIEEIGNNFLELLTKHNRLDDLENILKKLEQVYLEDEKTSLKIDLEYAKADPKEKFLAVLKEKFPDKIIEVNSRENKTLIAGLKVYYKGKIYDNSVKGVLNQAKKRLVG
jgi:F0F1-type ATP synthase delta subunit